MDNRTYTIVVVEHRVEADGEVDHDDPTAVTSDFQLSYATDLQYKVVIDALHAYVAARGLKPLEDVPPRYLPAHINTNNDLPMGEPGAGFCCTEGPGVMFAVYSFTEGASD